MLARAGVSRPGPCHEGRASHASASEIARNAKWYQRTTLILRPFRVGDEIAVGETEGRVTRVRLRATEIRTYDGRLVLVPNSEVFTSRVVNNTASPVRRATLRAILGYNVDASSAMSALVEAVRCTPDVLPQPPPSAQVAELGSADVVVEVRFWTDSRRSDYLQTLSAARIAVLSAAKVHQIRLPDAALRVVALAGQPQREGRSERGD